MEANGQLHAVSDLPTVCWGRAKVPSGQEARMALQSIEPRCLGCPQRPRPYFVDTWQLAAVRRFPTMVYPCKARCVFCTAASTSDRLSSVVISCSLAVHKAWCQVARATKYCTVVPDVCGSSAWNWFLADRVWSWRLYFWKICVSLLLVCGCVYTYYCL
jgi:hypothetical protein